MTDEQDKPTTIRSLKKEFEEFKAWVAERLPEQNWKPVHGVKPDINPEDVEVHEATESTTFHFTDRFKEPRIFSYEINGAGWQELAQTFQNNNQDKIKKREDK